MFSIEVPNLSLKQIYDSGQCFRWMKLKDDKYIIPFRDVALKVEQIKDRLVMNCNDEQFYSIWYNYFDMQTDYMDLFYKVRNLDDYLKICANRSKGIRIVNQDLFEMIITFMLATATNIPRIKVMVSNVCEVCGIKHIQSMREAGKVVWYEFPSPEEILSKSDKLDGCNLGYRKDYIIQICQDIMDGWLDLGLLRSMEYVEAKEYLMQFNGIGEKVADCICLYGLHHPQSFPIDTHIEQILEREFGCDYELFNDWYLKDINEKGLVQQYMFHNEINPPKEVNKFGGSK